MNDPHVVALLYTIEHGQSVDYRKARPLDHEEAGFRVKITNQQTRFAFKEHYATEDAARKAIEDYVRAWEFSACLENGPDYFKLKFDYAQIEDRNPTPGVVMVSARPVRFEFKVGEATVVVSPPRYPPAPSGLKLTPDVQLMYDRYMDYRQGRKGLLAASSCILRILLSHLSGNVGMGGCRAVNFGSEGPQGRLADGRRGADRPLERSGSAVRFAFS